MFCRFGRLSVEQMSRRLKKLCKVIAFFYDIDSYTIINDSRQSLFIVLPYLSLLHFKIVPDIVTD